jgi:hypothetical protein
MSDKPANSPRGSPGRCLVSTPGRRYGRSSCHIGPVSLPLQAVTVEQGQLALRNAAQGVAVHFELATGAGHLQQSSSFGSYPVGTYTTGDDPAIAMPSCLISTL